jgi:hypothetical protein
MFFAAVSGQRNSLIFEGNGVQDVLTLEDVTDTLSRNVGKKSKCVSQRHRRAESFMFDCLISTNIANFIFVIFTVRC